MQWCSNLRRVLLNELDALACLLPDVIDRAPSARAFW
jgi:hypothetical protein